MTVDEAKAQLQAVVTAMQTQFAGPAARDRMDQLVQTTDTVSMIIDHLFEEASRMDGYTSG